MKELIYKNRLLLNNNYNEVQHYQKFDELLNQKQEQKHLVNNDQLFSTMRSTGKKLMRKTTENDDDGDTIIRRVNEHSYIITVDKLQQKTGFHSRKFALADIHTKFVRNKENLSTSHGFIHIKEYALNDYECQCHKRIDLLNDKEINNKKHVFNHRLEF